MAYYNNFDGALKAFEANEKEKAIEILNFLIKNTLNRSKRFERRNQIERYRYYRFRARIYLDLKSLDEAWLDIVKALEIDRMDDYVYSLRGRYFYSKGQFSEARESFRYAKYIAKEEKNDYYFGLMSFDTGDMEEAERLFLKALKTGHYQPDVIFFSLGKSRLKLKKFGLAYNSFILAECFKHNKIEIVMGIASSLLGMSKQDAKCVNDNTSQISAKKAIENALYHLNKGLFLDKNNTEILKLRERCLLHRELLGDCAFS